MRPPLTLIVATTPSLGIGRNGTLPWPMLKTDLAFFARVTKRAPATNQGNTDQGQATQKESGNGDVNVPDGSECRNAVIMGRKTWESIPAKMRPLKGRINIVVSRQPEKLQLPGFGNSTASDHGQEQRTDPCLAASSVENGLDQLQQHYLSYSSHSSHIDSKEEQHFNGHQDSISIGRVFIIGGAEIYKYALTMPECERVLWTRLRKEYDCDTFFPPDVLPSESSLDAESAMDPHSSTSTPTLTRWSRRSGEDLCRWTGEPDAFGVKREGDVEFEYIMMERHV